MPTGHDSPDAVLAAFAANGMYPVGTSPIDDGRWQKFEPEKSKYRNRKTEIDGRVFASKKEAMRYLDLKEQQRAGLIVNLRCQVPIPLIVNGRKIGEYVADFVYVQEAEVIEDVKSSVTRKLPVYRLKRKILEANGINIQEV